MASHTVLEEGDFSSNLMNALNNTALGMGVAIGDHMGLFRAMSLLEEPATSACIATKSGLNERLGKMASLLELLCRFH